MKVRIRAAIAALSLATITPVTDAAVVHHTHTMAQRDHPQGYQTTSAPAHDTQPATRQDYQIGAPGPGWG